MADIMDIFTTDLSNILGGLNDLLASNFVIYAIGMIIVLIFFVIGYFEVSRRSEQ